MDTAATLTARRALIGLGFALAALMMCWLPFFALPAAGLAIAFAATARHEDHDNRTATIALALATVAIAVSLALLIVALSGS